jgi:nitrite reductase (NADH) small subunit/3-phenylpropionate/trans-cinnamate dioxygenase ferredoxin subunit
MDNDFVTVARKGDIPEGTGAAFPVGDRVVAVFNDGGRYFALDDRCPHMGASLAAGRVEDGSVVCALHEWRFRLSDGTWADYSRLRIDSFEVRVQDDRIQVRRTPRPKSQE